MYGLLGFSKWVKGWYKKDADQLFCLLIIKQGVGQGRLQLEENVFRKAENK